MTKKFALAGAAVALALGSVAIAQTYQEPANQPAAGAQGAENQPGATGSSNMANQPGATGADTTATGADATGADAAAAGSDMQYAGERG